LNYNSNRRPLNVANSYNYENAFVMEEDHYLLNYPKILYSRGHVETPDSAKAALDAGSIKFNWLPQNQSVYCQYTDLASFLVYNPAKHKAVIAINAIDRYSLEYSIVLPADFEGGTVHCYMNFASANGKVMGDSVYVGAIEVGTVEVDE